MVYARSLLAFAFFFFAALAAPQTALADPNPCTVTPNGLGGWNVNCVSNPPTVLVPIAQIFDGTTGTNAGSSTGNSASDGGNGGDGGSPILEFPGMPGSFAIEDFSVATPSAGIYITANGGNGGNGGDCNGCVGSAGNGGNGGNGGNPTVTVDSNLPIFTDAMAQPGVWLLSAGGLGGNGGDCNGCTGSAGNGGVGGSGGNITLNVYDSIVTVGKGAFGILAQSVGGGGGTGGGGFLNTGSGSGGNSQNGGTVTVNFGAPGGGNPGSIVTYGDNAVGILAQSIGGFGGSGGGGFGIFYGAGGNGANAGNGGTVNVNTSFDSAITTFGQGANGIEGESVGGNGGEGGDAGAFFGSGGSGSSGGSGGSVNIDNGATIVTYGAAAKGIFGQSVGGGGGDGGAGVGVIGLGGSGSTTSPGGDVTISNTGNITTNSTNALTSGQKPLFGASAIFAQSIGGGGGNGGTSVGAFSIGGSGGGGGDGGNVSVNNNATLITNASDSNGIFAQSVGGGGGNGGGSVGAGAFLSLAIGGHASAGGNGSSASVTSSGTINTFGDRSSGIQAQSVGGGGGNGGFAIDAAGGQVGFAIGIGGTGGGGGTGGTVNVSSSTAITTSGNSANGILAQSIGGGGGNGGFAIAASGGIGAASFALGGSGSSGGDAGNVTVSNLALGTLSTSGNNADGILAQSIGGGGGNGGFSVSAAIGAASAGLSVGGEGSGGGDAGTVSLTNHATVSTGGSKSNALAAQSIGGGGGNGGFSVGASASLDAGAGLSIGGSGANGGNGAAVTLGNSGTLTTLGDQSAALFAQSVGGGGGNGGFSVAGSLSIGPAAAIGIGGFAGGGGNGGTVSVTNSGGITTFGSKADAVSAQSIGGGGGTGGWSVAGSFGAESGAISLGIGGFGGDGGNGDTVSVLNGTLQSPKSIVTYGANANGIDAKSLGGGGGSGGWSVAGGITGGASLSLNLGGFGGGGGNGGEVQVANTSSITTGVNGGADYANGILAQSIGGGGGSGGFSVAGSLSEGIAGDFNLGGIGGSGGDSANVSVTNSGAISTNGNFASGINAQSIGGGGGAGGFAFAGALANSSSATLGLGGNGGTAGNAGTVSVTNLNNIVTFGGSYSNGILAQSIGGGGGLGGWSAAFGASGNGVQLSDSFGGNGGGAGSGSTVTVNSGAAGAPVTIVTHGAASNGILAQSIGGGGGDGGITVNVSATGDSDGEPDNAKYAMQIINLGYGVVSSICPKCPGSSGGDANNGGDVNVTSYSNIETHGDHSSAIAAQSIGGGGGMGAMTVGGAIDKTGPSDQIQFGSGGGGGNGGDVTLFSSGTLITHGSNADGILAQSIGGGGGFGGLSGVNGLIGDGVGKLGLSFGQSGDQGGDGGKVTLTNASSISTDRDNSNGIVAQSIGGGGGNGGFAIQGGFSLESGTPNSIFNYALGSFGGAGGNGGDVSVNSTGSVIQTLGSRSDGILAQSIGGGGGNGGFAINGAYTPGWAMGFSVGGSGGSSGNGGQAHVVNSTNIGTSGDLSDGISAQSIGGGGGNGGFAFEGLGTTGFTATLAVGGSSSGGGNGNSVGVFNSGAIGTLGESANAILAQSIGGGGGNGGAAIAGAITPSSAGTVLSFGASGGAGGSGGDVNVTNQGQLITQGDSSADIAAQSIGGGGGNGGFSIGAGLTGGKTLNLSFGGNGGNGGSSSQVTVSNSGPLLMTSGNNAFGILAQSIGGGGGNGGFTVGATAALGKYNLGLAFGGNGGTGGTGGVVSVNNGSFSGPVKIVTSGTFSDGILAQSIGGGGGSGGWTVDGLGDAGASLAFSLGGSGGSGNDAKNVIVNNAGGTIQTTGMGANGIAAQAIGGGGGSGGFNEAGQLDIASAGITAQSKFNFGNGGGGGNGANVEVDNTGQIFTSGENANGVLAQSIGGGGGYGGFSYGTALLGQWGIGLGSSTAGGGTGGAVTVINDGTIGTTGDNAAGVIAQSIGGGGGDGGFAWSAGLNSNISNPTANVGWALGSNGGNGGNGGLVTVTNNGVISTSGANSAGVIAQSIGGGGGNGGNATSGLASLTKYFEGFNLALGGNAGTTGSGGTVTVTNSGTIQTTGAFSNGVIAQSIGGGGGNGGNATSLIAIAGLDESLAYGGAGGSGGAGGNVTVNNSGSIVTTGFGSAPIVAQSISGGGGNGGSMISGSPITGGLFGFTLGGSGGSSGAKGTVTINNTGTLSSSGMFSGDLLAQSVGGGGGILSSALLDSSSTQMQGVMRLGATGGTPDGGAAISATNGGQLTTSGLGADAFVAQSVGGGGGIGGSDIALNVTDATVGGLLLGESGVSGAAGNGGAAALTDNAVAATSGDAADALLAQSISAGGGVGTFAIGGTVGAPVLQITEGTNITNLGSAGNVDFTTSSNALLQTLGFHSAAAAAQSIAGGGGTGTILLGGNISGTPKIGYTLGATGTGAATTGGIGATVTVSNSAQKIVTQGDLSTGLLAQSIGGGGGDAAFKLGGAISNAALSGVLGGSQLTAGSGGAVNVTNNGYIGDAGNGSFGMLAQSIGGGGGIGGFDTIKGILPSFAYAIGGTNDSGTLGGAMQIANNGQIVTTGIGDGAVVAQSIGGGGGEAGYALNLNLGTAATTLNLLAGGNGGSGDLGGAVALSNSAQIATGGSNAPDLLAQSVGGGGGNGGLFATGNLTTAGSANQFKLQVGGSGGTGNDGGAVQVTSTTVTSPNTAAYIANGDQSAALIAQSIGGGGGNASLNFNGAFSTGTPNTALVQIGGTKSGNGNTVTMNNTGSIATGLHTAPGVIEGAFSYGLLAQSIGGGGGNGVLTLDLGVPTSSTSSAGTINVNVGGKTGGNGNGAAVNVTDSDKIQTIGAEASGIVAQSIGGGGGNGAAVIVGNKTAPPPVPAQYKLNIAVGGVGSVGDGGNVTVTHSGGAIVTQGNEAEAILAQSIGGGGGNGGPVRSIVESHPTQCFTAIPACSARMVGATVTLGGNGSSGNGGTVTVNNTANLGTGGQDASGIVAQSIGGGGGIAGDAHAGHGDWDLIPNDVPAGTLKSWNLNVGGSHSIGNGGNVNVTDSGSISTQGDGSFGIFAQSVGGGGGLGGAGLSSQYGAGTIVAAGSASSSGSGGNVSVTVNNSAAGTTSIFTQGNGAYGIFAQSVGGGGGFAGELANGIGKTVIGKGSKLVSSTGSGGSGGTVTVVNNGNIKTTGIGAEGIFAQSIGGGGGLLSGFAGTAGLGGAAGAVSVTQNGVIQTLANNADAIFAQSAGGKGLAGNVTVNVTGMALAFGANADGVTAQSLGNAGNGNISITVNSNSIVQGGTGSGSAGVRILGGKNNLLVNKGTITTASSPNAQPQPMSLFETDGGIMGVQRAAFSAYQTTSLMTDKTALLSTFTGSTAYSAGTAVFANAGTLNLSNQGNIYGSLVLNGTNINFANSGTYVSGSQVNLGTGTLSLASGGVMTPGAGGFVANTDVLGNFVQSAGSDYLVNLDLTNNAVSQLNVSGTASLGGAIDLDLLSTNAAVPGAHSDTIVTAASGLTNNGVTLTPPKSAVATFNLGYLPDALLLNYDVNYAPRSGGLLNSNDLALGNYIGAIQSAGSSARLASFMSDVFGIPTIPKLKDFYDRFTPAATAVLSSSTLSSNLQFSDEMLRCRVDGMMSEGGNCSWARLGAQSSHETASFTGTGYGRNTNGIAAGFEHRIGTGSTLLGAAIHYSRDALFDGDNATSVSGNGLEAGVSASRMLNHGLILSADFLAGQGHYNSVRQLSYPAAVTTASGTQAISYIGTHLRAEQRFGGEIKAITPFLDFGVTHVNVGSLFESGAGTFNAHVAPYRTVYPTLSAGIRLEESRRLRTTALHGALDLWMTQIVGNPQASTTAVLTGAPATVAPFTVSNTLDRTQFEIGPSLDISRGDKTSVRIGATYNFSRHTHSGGAYIEVGTKI